MRNLIQDHVKWQQRSILADDDIKRIHEVFKLLIAGLLVEVADGEKGVEVGFLNHLNVMQLVSHHNCIFASEGHHDVTMIFVDELVFVHRGDQLWVVGCDHAFNLLTPLVVHILEVEGVGEHCEVVELLEALVLLQIITTGILAILHVRFSENFVQNDVNDLFNATRNDNEWDIVHFCLIE